MKQSKWMWCPGDFELYHGMLVHNRRTQGGVSCPAAGSGPDGDLSLLGPVFYPPMWRVDSPHRNLFLYKVVNLEKPETVTLYANTEHASILADGVRYPAGVAVTLKPGRQMVKVFAYKDGGFPAVYCVGDSFASDETWSYGSFGGADLPAGTNDMYTALSDNPEVFKFSYERISPVTSEKLNGGTLYDFGCERFGKLIFENVTPGDAAFLVVCGESREEALDPKDAIVLVRAQARNGSFVSTSVAFRYIFVPDFGGTYAFSADFEYLPLEDRGAFRCDDDLVNKIWEVSSYTLHLNAREGFFDGIKRDRWVWGGDAYQSFFVNYYLMNDNDIVRRTLRILRGAEPMTMHVNTIPDYTFYWIMSIWEYYYHTGDVSFVRSVYPQMRTTMAFIRGRLDEDGLYVKHPGDWVFVDWSKFDADSGPLCAEQMLLCRAYECMANCAGLLENSEEEAEYRAAAAALCTIVNDRYWDEEKGGFVDDYRTENRNITRHANIFALLYHLTSEERQAKIITHVIKNKEIRPITTPYFEFFELDAMCQIGDFGYRTHMLHSYWGGMIRLGATTIWEEYFPNREGAEHYAMYGRPYGKSLCHAWGASPIYLLGKYALGVRPTSPAYATFEVRPNLMCFGSFSGKVPTPNGTVEVSVSKKDVTVRADVDGGTLVIGERSYPIEKGKTLTVPYGGTGAQA